MDGVQRRRARRHLRDAPRSSCKRCGLKDPRLTLRTLVAILAIACAVALSVAWLLADRQGADFIEAFAQAFSFSLIGVGLAAAVWRPAERPDEGLGRLLVYLAFWLAAMGGVMALFLFFSRQE